jgi:hypothetical protein
VYARSRRADESGLVLDPGAVCSTFTAITHFIYYIGNFFLLRTLASSSYEFFANVVDCLNQTALHFLGPV